MGTSLFVPSALAMILWTAAAERPSSPTLPILTGRAFTGVVFPAAQARRERIDQPEARDYWTPSAADVAEMESRLRSALMRQRRATIGCRAARREAGATSTFSGRIT